MSFTGVQCGRHVANPFVLPISRIGKVNRDRPASFRLPLIQRRCRPNRRRTGSCLATRLPRLIGGAGTDVPDTLKTRFKDSDAARVEEATVLSVSATQTPGDRRDPGRDAGRTIGAIRPFPEKKVNVFFVQIFV